MQAAEHLQEILMGFQHFQTSTQKLAENDPKLSVLDIFFWRKMKYYHLKFFIVENMSEVGYLLKTSTLVSRPPKKWKKNNWKLSLSNIFACSSNFKTEDKMMMSQIFLSTNYAWSRTFAEHLFFFSIFP